MDQIGKLLTAGESYGKLVTNGCFVFRRTNIRNDRGEAIKKANGAIGGYKTGDLPRARRRRSRSRRSGVGYQRNEVIYIV